MGKYSDFAFAYYLIFFSWRLRKYSILQLPIATSGVRQGYQELQCAKCALNDVTSNCRKLKKNVAHFWQKVESQDN